jgi:hypothetical protein
MLIVDKQSGLFINNLHIALDHKLVGPEMGYNYLYQTSLLFIIIIHSLDIYIILICLIHIIVSKITMY